MNSCASHSFEIMPQLERDFDKTTDFYALLFATFPGMRLDLGALMTHTWKALQSRWLCPTRVLKVLELFRQHRECFIGWTAPTSAADVADRCPYLPDLTTSRLEDAAAWSPEAWVVVEWLSANP